MELRRTEEWSNRQKILQNGVLYYFREQIVLNDDREIQKKAPIEGNDIRVEYDLMNDLGFNLCVAPWSLVMRLVVYFGVKESCQNRGPKKVKQELEWTEIGIEPDDVNLQTECHDLAKWLS